MTERALPSRVRGPVESWELAILASLCATVDMEFAPGSFEIVRAAIPLRMSRPYALSLAWGCKGVIVKEAVSY